MSEQKTFKVVARAVIEYTVYPFAESEQVAIDRIKANDFHAWELGNPELDTIEIVSVQEVDERMNPA